MTLLFMLWACDGPNDATLLDTLKLVAAVADPPDVEVGEAYTLSVTVADPLGEGGDWLAWSCLPEVGCETRSGPLDAETIRFDAVGVAPLPVWFMACAPGACDLAAATEADLLDPTDWLATLPFDGVAVGSRFTRIVEPGAPRNENPVITRTPDRLDTGPEGELRLGFDAPGSERAWGLTTGGGFTMVNYDVGDAGNTELVWIAPKERGTYRVYVVFDDDEGGAVVWADDLEVR